MRRHALPAALAGALPVLLALEPRRDAGAAAGVCEMRLADRARADSRRCVACHDGSVARGVGARPHDAQGDHPVDVDYGRAFARRPGALRSPGALPPSLPLVGGKVACTTCHDAGSSERGKPAVTMRGSALCFACHAL